MNNSEKAAYVKSQGQTRDHTCHWPGCSKQIPPAQWGCREHWYKLPMHLRRALWAAYEPGQEITMSPSDRYIAAARAIQEWIKTNGNH